HGPALSSDGRRRGRRPDRRPSPDRDRGHGGRAGVGRRSELNLPGAIATVRRDAPDPIRKPFGNNNVGASPAGRYGLLPGEERRPDVVVNERVSYRVWVVSTDRYRVGS